MKFVDTNGLINHNFNSKNIALTQMVDHLAIDTTTYHTKWGRIHGSNTP